MRLLVDANLSPQLVSPLRQSGHDVVHVTDMLTASDAEILQIAESDRQMVSRIALSRGFFFLGRFRVTPVSRQHRPSGIPAERTQTPPALRPASHQRQGHADVSQSSVIIRGSFVLNNRSKRHDGERGTLQYELVMWLKDQGFVFAEDFVWGKPSPPGRWKRYLKDAVEYCFQFAKTTDWQFFPEHCLTPARWDRKDVERRKKYKHNYERVDEPSGQGRKRVQAAPDMVRPSTLLYMEPEFLPNPTEHPARFPVGLPEFFIKLMTEEGQLVFDPFGGTCTTAVAAENLGRTWLVAEMDEMYTTVLPDRIESGK